MRLKIPLIVASLSLSTLALAADKDGQWFATKVFSGGRLGVEAIQISKEVRQILGAPEDAGVLVNRVNSDSVAAEAGVKPGDVIVQVEGQKVKDVSTIRSALADKEAGQTAQLVVIRDKKQTTLTAKLREKPSRRSFSTLDWFDGGDVVFPKFHGDFDKLNERLGELEKRLEKLESAR